MSITEPTLLVTHVVTARCGGDGEVVVEVPTHLGADAACRRAHVVLAANGFGDLDEIEIVGCGPAS